MLNAERSALIEEERSSRGQTVTALVRVELP